MAAAASVTTPPQVTLLSFVKQLLSEEIDFDDALLQAESKGHSLAFSREALRHFLCTHKRMISHNDFATAPERGKQPNRNAICNSSSVRKTKSNAPLGPGGLLLEYVRGLDAFKMALGRAEKEDLEALMAIVNQNKTLPHNTYELANRLRPRLKDIIYEVDRVQYNRINTHVRLPIGGGTFKRTAVLLTGNGAMLMYDGVQLHIPTQALECKFSYSSIKALKMDPQIDFYFLDVLLCGGATKCKLIDIIDMHHGDNILMTDYVNRLRLLTNILPSVQPIEFADKVAAMASNIIQPSDVGGYIQKPLRNNENHNSSFVFYKPNITTVALGLHDKNVCLAFRESNESQTLLVKMRPIISGPATFTLLHNPLRDNSSNQIRESDGSITIFMEGENAERFQVYEGLDNVQLYEKALTVEFNPSSSTNKSCNNVYSLTLSAHDISCISEFKAVQQTTKEVTMSNDAMIKTLVGEFTMDITKAIPLLEGLKKVLPKSFIKAFYQDLENEHQEIQDNIKNLMRENVNTTEPPSKKFKSSPRP